MASKKNKENIEQIDEIIQVYGNIKLPKSYFMKMKAIKNTCSTLYGMQKVRIQINNRISNYIKRYGDSPYLDILRREHDLLLEREEFMEKEVRKLLRDVKIYREWVRKVNGVGTRYAGTILGVIVTPERFDRVSSLIKYAGQHVVYKCKICKDWITTKDAEGYTVFADKTVAELHQEQHGEPCLIPSSPVQVAGIKVDWHPLLKSTCWKLGDQLVRNGRFYREYYDAIKPEEVKKNIPRIMPVELSRGYRPIDERKEVKEIVDKWLKAKKKKKQNEPWMRDDLPFGAIDKDLIATLKRKGIKEIRVEMTGLHVDKRAKRRVVKLFLSHLWHVWREMEGLPVTKPYPIDVLGHSRFIKPPKPDDDDKI